MCGQLCYECYETLGGVVVIALLLCNRDFFGNVSFLAIISRLNLKSIFVYVCILHFLKHYNDIVSCLWTYAEVPKMLFCVPNQWPQSINFVIPFCHMRKLDSDYLLHET